jgi:hypothetical protein
MKGRDDVPESQMLRLERCGKRIVSMSLESEIIDFEKKTLRLYTL